MTSSYGRYVLVVTTESIRRRTRTTNRVERLNEELRRRERVIRIFANRESAVCLLGTLLIELDEKWRTRRHYHNMTELLGMAENHTTHNECGPLRLHDPYHLNTYCGVLNLQHF